MRSKLLSKGRTIVMIMFIILVGALPMTAATYSYTAFNLNEEKALSTVMLIDVPEPEPEIEVLEALTGRALVKKYAKKYDVSWRMVEAIIIHETGNRTSNGFRNRHNSCGMMGRNGLLNFPDERSGVESCVRNIRTRYFDRGMTTFAAMQPVYAPVNPEWTQKVTRFYNNL